MSSQLRKTDCKRCKKETISVDKMESVSFANKTQTIKMQTIMEQMIMENGKKSDEREKTVESLEGSMLWKVNVEKHYWRVKCLMVKWLETQFLGTCWEKEFLYIHYKNVQCNTWENSPNHRLLCLQFYHLLTLSQSQL